MGNSVKDKFEFENYIEKYVMEDAINFYYNGQVPINSSMWCESCALGTGRDAEEAKLLYAVLFPYAVHHVGEIHANGLGFARGMGE
jgi:hypothetical protein